MKNDIMIEIKPLYEFIKRIVDVIGSIIGSVVAIPLTVIFSILVVLETPGCPIYVQDRLGKNGKSFKIFKIRSMRIDAEKDGAQWATQSDNRVTKIGKFIRKTRIDELPQLLNILIGDMSIVGPRPEREFFYDKFEQTVPGFRKRLMVKPGLSGWAQVNGGYENSPAEKLEHDLYYINHRSLLLDIKIVFSTITVIFTGDGAR